MRIERFSAAAAAVAVLVGVPSPGSSHDTALGEGEVVCPANLSSGSCNRVFRDTESLLNLSPDHLAETVHNICKNFPDGPYRRAGTTVDYVMLTAGGSEGVPPTLTLMNQDVNEQIGTDLPAGVATTLAISGTTGPTPLVSITQSDGAKSQIIDLPGFDFLLFEDRTQGPVQKATLVCEIKMWYRIPGGPRFGIRNFQLTHPISHLTVGFVGGPSGMLNQANAEQACTHVIDAEVPNYPGTPGLEKKVSYLAGIYKVTQDNAVTQASPTNVTGCGTQNAAAVLANYCDPEEDNGTATVPRPNACNPSGESGNLPQPNIAGVNGDASTCYYWSRGTPVSFPC